jgi:hypothetical protein
VLGQVHQLLFVKHGAIKESQGARGWVVFRYPNALVQDGLAPETAKFDLQRANGFTPKAY